MERQTNFKVVIRIRPPIARELSGEVPFQNIVNVDEREQLITVSDNIEEITSYGNQQTDGNSLSFVFDHVYDQHSNQKKIFDTTARTVVESALQGYNATIFAYGQTGTGKTYTMEGFNRDGSVESRGIIPRAIEQIFGHVHRYACPRVRFLVRASYLQIYNEQISDLLKPERSNLTIREDKRRGVYVEGLSEWVVRSPEEIYGLMERGGTVRATGETKMNEASSRSHAVFIIIVEQSETVYVDDHGTEMTPEDLSSLLITQKSVQSRAGEHDPAEIQHLMEQHVRQSFKVGKLNLVDLAGSERVRLSGATGQRLEESKMINKSLSALGNVIAALTDTKPRQHIPYRDSKLTRILEDSLGGNCKTTMMAMISPALESIQETISTLKFANRAKNIRNEARVNEDLDQKSLLRKYERELKRLRAELEAKSKNVVDKRKLLELDEQRRRAEADKMAAIRALESRSLEFMREKEEKKRLEQRIAMLMSQMIRGDRSQEGNGSIDVHHLVKEHQEKLRLEYENKLAELERERETMEEERAQVDRYKQLLLKQRDIMIALTQRLVERDEQIMSLQDELDSYEVRNRLLQEKLDEKTTLLIKLQRVAMEVNSLSNNHSDELTYALEAMSDVQQQKQQQEEDNINSGVMPLVSIATEIDSNSTDSDEATTSINGNDKIRNQNNHSDLSQTTTSCSITGNKLSQNYTSQNKEESDVLRKVENILLTMKNSGWEQKDIISMKSNVNNLEGLVYSIVNRYISDAVRVVEEKVLSQQLRRLKDENIALTKQLAYNFNSEDTKHLQERCEVLSRERSAVLTILEQKVQVLVSSVAQAVSVVLDEGSTGTDADTVAMALAKDMSSLQRLVSASVTALKSAIDSDKTTPNMPPPLPAVQSSNNPKPGSDRGNASPPPPPPASLVSNKNNSFSTIHTSSYEPLVNFRRAHSTGDIDQQQPIYQSDSQLSQSSTSSLFTYKSVPVLPPPPLPVEQLNQRPYTHNSNSINLTNLPSSIIRSSSLGSSNSISSGNISIANNNANNSIHRSSINHPVSSTILNNRNSHLEAVNALRSSTGSLQTKDYLSTSTSIKPVYQSTSGTTDQLPRDSGSNLSSSSGYFTSNPKPLTR